MASLAVVYLGEPRNANTAAQQHQHLLDQLPVSEILDWTWPNRASHQDLDCSERTQIRDFFDALPQIHGSHFLKLRRDVWISDEAMPHLVQGIRSMLSQDIDWFFAGMDYQGPNAPAQTLERMKTAGAEWVADLVVAGDINRINAWSDLCQHYPLAEHWRFNHGWWLLPTLHSRCREYRGKVIPVRQDRISATDSMVIEDFYHALRQQMHGTRFADMVPA